MDRTHRNPPLRSRISLPDELVADVFSAIHSRNAIWNLSWASFHLRRHALAHNLHSIECHLDLNEAADLLYLKDSALTSWEQRVTHCIFNGIKMRVMIGMASNLTTSDPSAGILQAAAHATDILSHADTICELVFKANSFVWEHALAQLVLRSMPILRILAIEVNGPRPAVLRSDALAGSSGLLERVRLNGVRCKEGDTFPAFDRVKYAELFDNDLACLDIVPYFPRLSSLELTTMTADISRFLDEQRINDPYKLVPIFGRCESVTFRHYDDSVDWSRNLEQLQYLWYQAVHSDSFVFLVLEFPWHCADIGSLISAATESICSTGDGFEHVSLLCNRQGISIHADTEGERFWLNAEILHPVTPDGVESDWQRWTEERNPRLLHLVPAFNRAMEFELPFHLLGAAKDIFEAVLTEGNIESIAVDITEELIDDFTLWSDEPLPSAFVGAVTATIEWDIPVPGGQHRSRRTGRLADHSVPHGLLGDVYLVVFSSRAKVETTLEYLTHVAISTQLIGPNSRDGFQSVRFVLDNVELADRVEKHRPLTND